MRHYDSDDERVVIIEKHGSVGSFLLGVGIGAAAAILLAPQSGDQTRRDLARRAQGAGDAARRSARGLAGGVSTEVTDRIDRARTAVVESVDRARGAVELKRQQVQRAVEAGRVAAQQAREDLERRIAETKAAYQAGVSRGGTPQTGTPQTGTTRAGAGVAPAGYESAESESLDDAAGDA